MKNSMTGVDKQVDTLAMLNNIDDDLTQKREKFISYLKMSEFELQENPAFVSFLIFTTDDLIEKATRLNSILRNVVNTALGEEKQEAEDILVRRTILRVEKEAVSTTTN